MNKGGRPVIYIPFEENADSLLENSFRTVELPPVVVQPIIRVFDAAIFCKTCKLIRC